MKRLYMIGGPMGVGKTAEKAAAALRISGRGLVLGCPPLSGDGGDPGDGVGEHLFSPEQLPPLLRL